MVLTTFITFLTSFLHGLVSKIIDRPAVNRPTLTP